MTVFQQYIHIRTAATIAIVSVHHLWCALSFLMMSLILVVSAKAQEEVVENSDNLRLTNGINFFTSDSAMMLTLRFRMQNQASLESQSARDLSIKDAQFTIRRVRMRMNGFVVSPQLTYLLQLGFSRSDTDFENSGFFNVLRDAMIVYRVQPNLHFGIGQGKLPGNRERVISSGEQQFIDRSIVNRTFNLDRDVGINAYYSHTFGDTPSLHPRLSVRLAVATGMGRSPAPRISDKFLYAARLSFFPLGNFSNNGDYYVSDLAFEKSPKFYIAAAAARNDNALRSGGTIGTTLFEARSMDNFFIDGIFKYAGFSFYGEYARRFMAQPLSSDGTSIRAAFAGDGLNLQAGYFVAENWEVSARYSSVEPVPEVKPFLNGQTQYTLCLTRFLNGHRVKVQGDLTYNILRTLPAEQASWIARFQVELGL
ncbi:MAG: porin [Candidatus Kapaibacterium sp.]|nr:MAG: porin [Candidatus Kapabacteria bacterium]